MTTYDPDDPDISRFNPARGAAIKRTRGRLHLTQQELADAVGVSRTAITDWESGKPIAMTNAARLADVLGSLRSPRRDPPTERFAEFTDVELIEELTRRAARRAAVIEAAGIETAADRAEESAMLDELTSRRHREREAAYEDSLRRSMTGRPDEDAKLDAIKADEESAESNRGNA